MNRRTIRVGMLGTLALTSFALAATTTYNVVVNGQGAADQAIVVGGKTYVPLSAVKLLGVNTTLTGNTLTLGSTPAGGANQRASLEGCLGTPLFNGVWRLSVKSVRPISRYNGQQQGYGLTLTWKNGTVKTIDALNTGVKAFTLVLADGTVLDSENVQDVQFKHLPQAAGTTLELPYYAPSGVRAAAPSKLLVEIQAAGAAPSGVAYTSPTPSFRVRLDCQN
ncbi:hypothetical protein MF271_18165 (plasmid) [Deinococcus sp. KNUC1210]|uniref:hypothetical protein n=1 Tax=Deinococcus sp. KNUC1210 TaxID=2917691 RepID=UPI001EF0161C|nr:hypothetical protein [Deinococcus sp. KNUC1210]ULH17283.1 hypothetical protein MF271_18165 [Deinococcus sp. KNUC1210]